MVGSDAKLEQVTVRYTSVRASDATYGDGIAAVAFPQAASVSISSSRVEQSDRAGITNFGSSIVLESSLLECNTLPLHGEPFEGHTFGFTDLGGNTCGCAGETLACKVSSVSLAPPTPLTEAPPLP